MAQQSDIPVNPQAEPTKAATQPERIVEGRPPLYSVKRVLHPITWIYAGIRPVLGIAEKAEGTPPARPPDSGVKARLISLGPGSGVGVEIKPFHYDLFGSNAKVEVPLAITTKMYESFGFRTSYPIRSAGDGDRVAVGFTGEYGSRPSENFFGIGNDTIESNHSQFRSVTRTAAIGLDTHLTDAWAARVEARYRDVGITEPRNFTSTQSVTSQSMPGFNGADMRSLGAALVYDSRDRKAFAGSGTLQQFKASVNESAGNGDYSYWRFQYNAQQLFPLSQDHRTVIALRGEMETNRPKGGSSIPFFDLPTIGNPETLPGFEPRRFTDKSVVDYSVEYRYRIWRHFDWALFASQGQVAPQIGDFGWSRFHTGYGMRFLVRPPGDLSIAVTAGKSREGWTFYLDFSPTF